MSRNLLATAVAAILLALAPMMTATGVQSFQTFAEAQVSIPSGTSPAEAATLFCAQREFSGASGFDLQRLHAATGDMQGMAYFNSITCRTRMLTTATGGLLP